MNPAATRLASYPLSLAALAGGLAVAAFEPAGLALLAPAAIALLALLCEAAPNAWRAALTGFAFGLGYFGIGVSWVYVSLHDFGMMPAALAALATALFCAFLALFVAAAGFLQLRLGVPRAARLLLVMPSAWVVLEWLRSWLFTGFPWLSLGYSQTSTTLAGLAPLVGVFGVSLAVTCCGGLLAFGALGSNRQRLAALAGIALLFATGWGLRQIAWTSESGAPVSVALAQGNVPQNLKFEESRYAATLNVYHELVGRSHAQLVVLPETAIPRFLDRVDPTYLRGLAELARARQADLLLGTPMRDASGAYYNSVVSLGISPSQTYSKIHLVPFGEFVPPGFDWILSVLRIPLSDFSAGPRDQRPLQLAGGLAVAVNICYEDAFGEEIVRQLPQATLLVNVSNVAWFGDSLAPEQHLQISRMRAIETGRFMLRATNSGVTAIIDERGRLAARLPTFTEGLLQGSAQPYSGATPFVRMGNAAAVLLSLAMLLAAGLWGRLSARRAPT